MGTKKSEPLFKGVFPSPISRLGDDNEPAAENGEVTLEGLSLRSLQWEF